MNGSLSPIYKKIHAGPEYHKQDHRAGHPVSYEGKKVSPAAEVHMIKHITIKTPYISKYLAKSPSNTVSLPVPAKSNSLSKYNPELTLIGYRKYHP